MYTEIQKANHYFLVTSIPKDAGGRTRVTLKRTNLFTDANIGVTLISSSLSANTKANIESYVKVGLDATKAKLIQIYDYYNEKYTTKEIEYLPNFCQGNFFEIDDNIYQNGILYASKKYNKDGKSISILYYDNNKKVVIEDIYYDNIKRHSKTNKYKVNDVEKYEELYYSKDGFCFLSIFWQKIDGNFTEEKVLRFNPHTQIAEKFDNLEDFKEVFFSEIVNELSQKNEHRTFVYVDSFSTCKAGFSFMNNDIIKIGLNHSGGLSRPVSIASKINQYFLYNAFNNSNTVDAMINLTRSTTQDYIRICGNRTFFYTIPNTIDIPKEFEETTREPFLAVTIARLESQKNIHDSIKAFKLVVEKIPTAKFYVYGKGELKKSYEILIEELKLQKNVFIKGFTDSPYQILKQASCSLITSSYEGFSLSLYESLACGCPCISYDFKYGASEVIIEGQNGYLVKMGDIETFANKIIDHFQNAHSNENMSKYAYESVLPYSKENHLNTWFETLNTILEREEYKIYLESSSWKLTYYSYSSEKKGYFVEGIIELSADIPTICYGREKFYIRIYDINKTDYEKVDCDYKILEDTVFNISFNVETIKTPISVCLEWQNIFVEFDEIFD